MDVAGVLAGVDANVLLPSPSMTLHRESVVSLRGNVDERFGTRIDEPPLVLLSTVVVADRIEEEPPPL
jgi:hypothetical protein